MVAVRQLLWALLLAGLSLPVAYALAVVGLSLIHRGYVKVDPVQPRRTAFVLAALVFIAAFLLQRFA